MNTRSWSWSGLSKKVHKRGIIICNAHQLTFLWFAKRARLRHELTMDGQGAPKASDETGAADLLSADTASGLDDSAQIPQGW